MTEEQKTKIQEMWEQAAAAKKDLDLGRISMHLDRYMELVWNMRKSISKIHDYESFRNFRTKWRESGGISMLPKELTAFNNYLSLANAYNAELIPVLLNSGTLLEYAPIMFSEEEIDVIKKAEEVYKRPFSWEKIKNRLVGEQARVAVYTHAVAVLNPEDFCDLINDGSIHMETLESLPYSVTLRGISGDGKNNSQLQQDYRENLEAIYEHYGKTLPNMEIKEVGVNGVSFENRPQKLNYLFRWAKAMTKDTGKESVVTRKDGDFDFNNALTIELDRYIFHDRQNHVDEPAIRVLATIPGDPKFARMDIGHIPREIAIDISNNHPDATICAEINEIGITPIAKENGTVPQPYVKLALAVADKPVEMEWTLEANHSKEVDDLFKEELR